MILKVHLDFARVRFEIVLEALQVAIRFPATIREEHPRIQPAEDAEKRKLLRVQILWHAFHFGQEFEIVIGLNTIKEHATDMSRKKEREREREREQCSNAHGATPAPRTIAKQLRLRTHQSAPQHCSRPGGETESRRNIWAWSLCTLCILFA